MESSWTEPDWDAPRPDALAVSRSLARLRYEPIALPQPSTDALLEALRHTRAVGNVWMARFRLIGDDEVIGWFGSRNRFNECDFFQHFLGSAAVLETLPELQRFDPPDGVLDMEETWSGTYSLDGELAAILMHGGAYQAFPGAPAEAKQLGAAFVDAIVGDRHDQFHVYQSSRKWSPFFFGLGPALDSTYLIIDLGKREIVLLVLTDVD